MANVVKCRIQIVNDDGCGMSSELTETHERCPYEALPRAIGEALLRTELESGWRRDFAVVETLVRVIDYIGADPDDSKGTTWPNKERLADVIRAVKAWTEADTKDGDQ